MGKHKDVTTEPGSSKKARTRSAKKAKEEAKKAAVEVADRAAQVAAEMEEAARMAAEVAKEVAADSPLDEAPPAPTDEPPAPTDEPPAPTEEAPAPAPAAVPAGEAPKKRKKSDALELDDRQRRELAEYVQSNPILYDHSIKGWNKAEKRDPIWQWWADKEKLNHRHHFRLSSETSYTS